MLSIPAAILPFVCLDSSSLDPFTIAFMTTEDILSCQIMLMGKKVKVKSLSRVRLFVTPWTVAYRAPPPMGFSGQRYWSGVPFPSPEDLPDPGMEPRSTCIAGRRFTL